MANIKLVFCGTETSETKDHELQCYRNSNDEVFIQIETPNEYPSFICLDASTAIKLSKVLRQSINEIKEAKNV